MTSPRSTPTGRLGRQAWRGVALRASAKPQADIIAVARKIPE